MKFYHCHCLVVTVMFDIVSGGSRNDEVSCNPVMAGEGHSVEKGGQNE